MNTTRPAVAATQGLLILPAALFMAALVVRTLPLPQSELVLNAQRIVMWYAGRQWTLWVLLILLPLAVLVAGCLTLLSSRNRTAELPPTIRPRVATVCVTTATVMAGGILAIVVLHVLAN
ncbi:MAG TPA: hypothetical protein VKV73_21605 [Chloroflexota bacterium]|nr:hypothetical protein [Chloroflexota bacterium]